MLHNSKTAGYPGMSRMKLTICSRFNWKGLRELSNMLNAKRGPRRQRTPLQLEINGAPFDHVAFDVIGPLPTMVNGNRIILTVIDYFSQWADAYAPPNLKL